MTRVKCSTCNGIRICELQWHHVNDYVLVKGKPYHKMEEGEYFNTAYCDNDYQCLDCWDKNNHHNSGSNVKV